MKISSQNTNMVNQSYGRNQVPAPASDNKKEIPATRNVDNVSLSSATKDLQKVYQTMDTTPSHESQDRSERISALKKKIETGQYKVDAEKVAESIMGFFIDKTA